MNTVTVGYSIVCGSIIDGIQLYSIAFDDEILEEDMFDDEWEAQAFVNYLNYAKLDKNEIEGALGEYFDSPSRIFRCGKK